MGRGVTVTRLALTQLFQVRILAPQPTRDHRVLPLAGLGLSCKFARGNRRISIEFNELPAEELLLHIRYLFNLVDLIE